MKSSTYYPPRATSWSRFRVAMHRQWLLIRMPRAGREVVEDAGLFLQGIPWLLVPGLMWWQQGRPRLGIPVMAVWAALVAVHVVSLNPASANLAAMIASTLHAFSAAAVLSVRCPHWQGLSRIVRTVIYTSLLVLIVYSVGLRSVTSTFAQRITLEKSTVMIHRSGQPWAQGDWVAYRLPQGNTSFDRILAVPGDTIRFHRDSFEVNGRHFERLSELMPTDAEWTMLPGNYFIWPATVNVINGRATEILSGLAEIPEADILGKPYRRWFGNVPHLEPLKPLSTTPAP
jgi:hypothetical protein